MLWKTLLTNFTLPPEVDLDDKVIERKVKAWNLKKMATQFSNYKKRLHKDYILRKKTLDFTGANEKLKDHWDEFVEYKTLEEAKKRSEINKKNAAKKEYHHCMGSGGYKGAKPKLEKYENDLFAKGIIPETLEWAERAKLWLYGHGGKLNPETGKCIFTKEQLATPLQALKEIMKDV